MDFGWTKPVMPAQGLSLPADTCQTTSRLRDMLQHAPELGTRELPRTGGRFQNQAVRLGRARAARCRHRAEPPVSAQDDRSPGSVRVRASSATRAGAHKIGLVCRHLTERLLTHKPPEQAEAIGHLSFATTELGTMLGAMKIQSALERALRHKGAYGVIRSPLRFARSAPS